jgi:hypothetical protein
LPSRNFKISILEFGTTQLTDGLRNEPFIENREKSPEEN